MATFSLTRGMFVFLLAFLVFQNVSGESVIETEDFEDDMIHEIQKKLEELYTIQHKDELPTGAASDRIFGGIGGFLEGKCMDLIGGNICGRGRLMCRVPPIHSSIRLIQSMCLKTCGTCR